MSFPKIRITEEGRLLISSALAEPGTVSVKFTKFKIGSGDAPKDDNQWESFTDLVTPVMNVSITTYTRDQNDGTISLSGEFTNGNVLTSFDWKELGIYAAPVVGGVQGTEVMAFYGNAGALKEFVPSEDSAVAVRHRWTTQLVIASAADVSAVVHSIQYAMASDLNDHIQDHSNPHQVTCAQIGAPPLNHATEFGMYGYGTSTLYGHVKLSDDVNLPQGLASGGIAATPNAVYQVKQAAQAAQTTANNAAQIASTKNPATQTGSYVGQGRTGINNKNSITFTTGLPSVVVICQRNYPGRFGLLFPKGKQGFSYVDSYISHLRVSTSGNTVYWYFDSNESHPANQLDHSGQNFDYYGIM